MLALFRLRALFSDAAKLPETANKNFTLVQNDNCNRTRAVVVFSHHRDLKVALDELHHAGFSDDWITLITRNTQRGLWGSACITKNYFDAEQFNFSQVAQKFFGQLFQRGKYLVLLSGSGYDVNAASKIMSRRKDHAKVWRFE